MAIADACVVITDISPSTVTLSDPGATYTVTLDRSFGTIVADMNTGVVTAIRLAANNPEGSFGLQPSAIVDC